MGWRSKNVFGSFFVKFTLKIDLTNGFKRFFRDDSFKQCSKIAGFLGGLGGRTHACARARASEKLRTTKWGYMSGALGGRARTTKFGTCRIPYHEALVRASGKDLAQGQVALLDPT